MSGHALGAKLHHMYASAGHAFEHERDVRRRYQAAIAAAIESFRQAEQRFGESSAAIDVHIQRALAAVSLTASRVVISGASAGRPTSSPRRSRRPTSYRHERPAALSQL